ncbi:MAG TPA: lytic transglycosylase domain-containing protein [Acidisarcina sp.]|nr:lytic transglycosylase domain-containing protein [Acidisarcina sp.]
MKAGRKAGWTRTVAIAAALLGAAASGAVAADASALHVTLSNGFDLICDHRESVGNRVRLYLQPGSQSFVEVAGEEIVSVEPAPAVKFAEQQTSATAAAERRLPDPTPEQLHEMMSQAGAQHNLDVDLLASVVRAESGGNIRAVSRTGARGLMQLMPGTAAQLGVADSFRPEQNINGGTTYLDALLTRYHDDIPLALAAYNAGPAAVDRYHGIPPYHETRAYVARVIHEFNRRKTLAEREANSPSRRASQTASATQKHIQ